MALGSGGLGSRGGLGGGLNSPLRSNRQESLFDLQRRNQGLANDVRRFGGNPTPGPGILERIFDVLSRPTYAMANLVGRFIDDDNQGGLGGNLTDALAGAGQGLMGRDKRTFSDVLEQEGVENSVVRGVGGFALDVLLDPTTYLSLGTSAGAKLGAKSGRAAIQASRLDAATDVLRNVDDVIPKLNESMEAARRVGLYSPTSKNAAAVREDILDNVLRSRRLEAQELLKTPISESEREFLPHLNLRFMGRNVKNPLTGKEIRFRPPVRILNAKNEVVKNSNTLSGISRAFNPKYNLPDGLNEIRLRNLGVEANHVETLAKTVRNNLKRAKLSKEEKRTLGRALARGVAPTEPHLFEHYKQLDSLKDYLYQRSLGAGLIGPGVTAEDLVPQLYKKRPSATVSQGGRRYGSSPGLTSLAIKEYPSFDAAIADGVELIEDVDVLVGHMLADHHQAVAQRLFIEEAIREYGWTPPESIFNTPLTRGKSSSPTISSLVKSRTPEEIFNEYVKKVQQADFNPRQFVQMHLRSQQGTAVENAANLMRDTQELSEFMSNMYTQMENFMVSKGVRAGDELGYQLEDIGDFFGDLSEGVVHPIQMGIEGVPSTVGSASSEFFEKGSPLEAIYIELQDDLVADEVVDLILNGQFDDAIKLADSVKPGNKALPSRKIQKSKKSVEQIHYEELAREAGFKPRKVQVGPDEYIESWLPENVANALNDIQNIMTNDAMLNRLIKKYDKVHGLWKAFATVVNPGHHFRNLFGDIFLNFEAGVIDPNAYRQAFLALAPDSKIAPLDNAFRQVLGLGPARTNSKFVRIGGNNVSLKRISDLYAEQGLKSGFFNAEFTEVGAGIGARLNMGRALENVRELSSFREDTVRLAHFIDKLKKFGRQLEPGDQINEGVLQQLAKRAAAEVRKWNIDYADFTPFERNVVKRVVPFYSFMRKNLPLQIEALLLRPGKPAIIPKGQQAIETILGTDELNWRVEERIPDWMREAGGLMISSPGSLLSGILGNEPTQLNLDTPLHEAFGRFGSTLFPTTGADSLFDRTQNLVREGLNVTTPFVKTPVEVGTGRSVFTGGPLQQDNLVDLISSLLPAGRIANTAISGDNQDLVRLLTNWITGAGLQRATPERQEAELRRQEDVLRAMLAELGVN